MKLEECLLRYTNGAEVKYLGPVYHITSDRILEEFIQTFEEDILNIKDAFEGWEKYGEQICFRFEKPISQNAFELFYGTIKMYKRYDAEIVEIRSKQRSE